jgi:hypothetical protein
MKKLFKSHIGNVNGKSAKFYRLRGAFGVIKED